MRVLLIDDKRDLEKLAGVAGPGDFYRTARTFEEGIIHLKWNGPWDVLLLDHDLGHIPEPGQKEKDGYQVMCYLEEHPSLLPKDIRCVSSNSPGRFRIEQVINKLYDR